MKHHNQLRSGSLLTYVQMTLNIIVSIAYTPFMLRILGKSEYGLYSTVASQCQTQKQSGKFIFYLHLFSFSSVL